MQTTPHCQHQYVKHRRMRDLQKRQRLTEIRSSSGTGVPLGACWVLIGAKAESLRYHRHT